MGTGSQNDWLVKGLIGVGIAITLYFLKIYFRGGQFTENIRADGKVVVITGANSGVGRATTQLLNLRGAKVYMLCRDQKRAEAARRRMIEEGCDADRLLIRLVDMSNLKTIREFVERFKKEEEHVDILINNAGHMGLQTFTRTVDGYEETWQSNYLGHFLLTQLLLPLLTKAKEGRIVGVASLMHHYGDSVRSEIVNSPDHYGKWVWQRVYGVYSRSKLAMVMHARWLTVQLRQKGVYNVTYNTCHPGSVNSNILEPTGFLFIKDVFRPLLWFFLKSEEDGAQTNLFLALSPTVKGVSGRYFRDCAAEAAHPLVNNDVECERLYNESLEAVAEHR